MRAEGSFLTAFTLSGATMGSSLHPFQPGVPSERAPPVSLSGRRRVTLEPSAHRPLPLHRGRETVKGTPPCASGGHPDRRSWFAWSLGFEGPDQVAYRPGSSSPRAGG